MSIYDTYGLKTKDLETAKTCLENLLNVSFQPHESSYMGGLYYSKDFPNGGNYELQNNYSEQEGWVEEEYQDLGTIFKVSESDKSDLTRELLLNSLQEKILHIRRSVISETLSKDRWARTYQFLNGKDELILEQKLPELVWLNSISAEK